MGVALPAGGSLPLGNTRPPWRLGHHGGGHARLLGTARRSSESAPRRRSATDSAIDSEPRLADRDQHRRTSTYALSARRSTSPISAGSSGELFDRAYLDELTGLPNRASSSRAPRTLIEPTVPSDRFALAFIDLDNFKHINDYYSHAVGDALLVKVARALVRARCGRPTCWRAIGGDEFVLLLDADRQTSSSLQAELEAIVERLKQPFFIDGHEIFASASIGRQPLSRARPHLRDAAPQRRQRHVPRQERREGRRHAVRRRRWAMPRPPAWRSSSGCAWRSATAASAAPSSPRSTSAPHEVVGRRGAAALARRAGHDPGPRRFRRPRRRTRA